MPRSARTPSRSSSSSSPRNGTLSCIVSGVARSFARGERLLRLLRFLIRSSPRRRPRLQLQVHRVSVSEAHTEPHENTGDEVHASEEGDKRAAVRGVLADPVRKQGESEPARRWGDERISCLSGPANNKPY